jgi:hypothetical protein
MDAREYFRTMSEEAGSSPSAIAARRAALSARHHALVNADQILAAAISEAHAVTVDAKSRLDTIGAQIDDAVAHQDLLALDTPEGVRDFQHFLLARHRDIIAVVTDAVARADAHAAQVQGLADLYRQGRD